MDPKQLAEEIIDSLFAEEADPREVEETEEELYDDDEELYEETEEDEDEDEDESDEEEDESDEEEDESDEDEDESEEDSAPTQKSAPSQPTASKGGNVASTLSMKPSMASASLPSAPSSGGDLVSDANGGSTHDINGKGDELGTKQYVGGGVAASLAMKPSAASPQIPVFGPVMNKEELQRDVRAMFGGSEDLSEEFVAKAASLYEAAVVTKINQIAGALRNELAEQFENKIVQVKETLEEQLDTYLNYVVEEWIKENELAVENGLRTEISENFIRGLKNLFTESYIEVPQDKTNAFDELSEAVSHLENRLNEEIETNASLVNKIKSLKAQQIFQEQTSHLTAIEAEQIRPLVENVSFENEEDFSSKIKVLVEGVVSSNKPKKVLKESKKEQKPLFERVILEEETEQETVQLSPAMEVYSKVLERSIQN